MTKVLILTRVIIRYTISSGNIILEMNGYKKPSLSFETNKLCNYIFFFFPKHFLPHFPSVNIRTNGVDIMLEAYKEVMVRVIKI